MTTYLIHVVNDEQQQWICEHQNVEEWVSIVPPLSEVFEGPVIPFVHWSSFIFIWVGFVQTTEQFWIDIVGVNVFEVFPHGVWFRVNDTNLCGISTWNVFDPSTLLFNNFGCFVSENSSKHFLFIFV